MKINEVLKSFSLGNSECIDVDICFTLSAVSILELARYLAVCLSNQVWSN